MTARKRLHCGESTDDLERLSNAKRVCRGLSVSQPCSSMTCPKSIAAPFTSQLPPPEKRRPFSLEEAKDGTDEPVRVYLDGIFDMFHYGHAEALMKAKNAFPNTYVIAGVCSDELTRQNKGITVFTEEDRYRSLNHCRYVDEVLTDAPWCVTLDFLDEHQIDFVVQNSAPYKHGDTADVYHKVKEAKRFHAIERTQGISTSDIIAKIVRNYDGYVSRNLERGYSARDLNIGFMKKKELQVKNKMNKVKEKSHEFALRVEERSKDVIGGFLGLFGRDGRIGEFLNDKKERFKRAFTSPSPSTENQNPLGHPNSPPLLPRSSTPPSPSPSSSSHPPE